MKKTLQSPRRIKFSDCDPMGHLYNAKYIQYLLDEREDQVEAEYGFNPIDHVKATGEGWVVVQNQISYLKPAIFNETVICESFVRNYDKHILEIECKMLDYNGEQVKAVLWTRFVYFNTRSNRATNHPEELMELFSNAKVELDVTDFEARSQYFRQMNRTIAAK